MDAIEFETDIINKYIEIKEYEKVANRHARVILLLGDKINSSPSDSASRFSEFLSKSKKVENITVFSRDELNDR